MPGGRDMKAALTAAIIDLLRADPALTTLLGGATAIFPGHISQGYQFPCVTVLENSETGKKRLGYFDQKTRDQAAVIQVDVWMKTSYLEAETVMNRVEAVLIPDPIDTTWGWEKMAEAVSFEPDLAVYHVMSRFRFEYSITDT
jgi:hypothetical protein